ncbi:MAG: hypothetical protein KGS73_09235 [Chloroflexi bacterium]|nr:hypothetical protein [Chloroflexota bacterium]
MDLFRKQFDSVAVQHGISFGFDGYRQQKQQATKEDTANFCAFQGAERQKNGNICGLTATCSVTCSNASAGSFSFQDKG